MTHFIQQPCVKLGPSVLDVGQNGEKYTVIQLLRKLKKKPTVIIFSGNFLVLRFFCKKIPIYPKKILYYFSKNTNIIEY